MKARMSGLASMIVLTGMVQIARGGDIVASFPDTTTLVARVDVAKLKQVPAIRQAWNDQYGQVAIFVDQIRNWIGLDLDSVTTLWLGVEKKDHGVFVLEGNFDPELIKGGVLNIDTAQIVHKESVPIAALFPDDKKPGQFNLGAVLNESTVVMGQPDVAERFIDAYVGAGQGLPVDKLRKVAHLKKATALVQASVLAVDPEELRKNPWMAYLTSGEFTADLDKDLTVRLKVGVQKADMLKPVGSLLNGLLAVYRQMDDQHKKQPPAVRALLENASATVAGDAVVLQSTVDEETLNDAVAARLNLAQ